MPEPQAWLALPSPDGWQPHDHDLFAGLANALRNRSLTGPIVTAALEECSRSTNPTLPAAALVLRDLAVQGWSVKVADRVVSVRPPVTAKDPVSEKDRVRAQEILKRNEQLSTASARQFVASMERPREHHGQFVSIYSLMRDGQELRESLDALGPTTDPDHLRSVIDPYVQVIGPDDYCPQTGLRLMDVWRYFRHTWTNQYTSTPGRTMMLLVRDRAAPCHPIIGIAALGSAIVQIKERDDWIGWQSDQFVARLADDPSLGMARWVARRLLQSHDDLFLDDLIEDGLYWPDLWDRPTEDAICLLLKEADERRRDHHRFGRRSDFKWTSDDGEEKWEARARSDLFRSKRCLLLAQLLRARLDLDDYLFPTATRSGLRAALADRRARQAISGVVRRAKAEAVGTEMADLTVCGSIAPYSALLGGKLVSMLSVSPSVVRAYRERYVDYQSEIASSMAGRPIRRRTNLAFVGTTSLYGSGASQYNRIRIPKDVLLGSCDIEFKELGRSRSYGTSHLAADTVRALVRLSEQSRTGVRVNSIFGEGVNPKLRKVRGGLDLLGWPSDQLLRHGRQRIVYGVTLVDNLLPYLLGVDKQPQYRFRRNVANDEGRITGWWLKRWLAARKESADVLAEVERHRLGRPARHGAQVVLPPLLSGDDDDDEPSTLF